MFCSKCGKEIADDSKFCLECGYEVKTNIVVGIDKPAKEIFTELPPTPPFEYKKFLGGLAVVAVLFFIGSIIFSFNK